MAMFFRIKWTESVLHFKFICHEQNKKRCFVLMLFQRAWNSLQDILFARTPKRKSRRLNP